MESKYQWESRQIFLLVHFYTHKIIARYLCTAQSYLKLKLIDILARVIENVEAIYPNISLPLCVLSRGQQRQHSGWWLWRGLKENDKTILLIQWYQVWVISPDWANVQVNGNGFTLNGNSRMYFASRPTDGFDADAYWQVRAFTFHYFPKIKTIQDILEYFFDLYFQK